MKTLSEYILYNGTKLVSEQTDKIFVLISLFQLYIEEHYGLNHEISFSMFLLTEEQKGNNIIKKYPLTSTENVNDLANICAVYLDGIKELKL